MTTAYQSWGRYPRASQQAVHLDWIHENPFNAVPGGMLPYGQGRSYGDCCLNDGGALIVTARSNRLIAFDAERGLLRCEAGVTLADILDFTVPRGWFLPVSPGTKFVSVGGAIANDVHGKNHHRGGCFGAHVPRFELLRSDGSRRICSAAENGELYRATIGGLGLTGLILWADVQLKKVAGALIDMESIKFGDLEEFFAVSGASDREYEYTVAWLDCVSAGSSFGRGIFMRGNHGQQPETRAPRRLSASIPLSFPAWALNHLTIKAFNSVWYGKQRRKQVRLTQHYDPFFYPLDMVGAWNRIYGKTGPLQFQCVVPKNDSRAVVREILQQVVKNGTASFLSVMKEFGDQSSPGLLSFPRPGVTLCMDFSFRGERTLELFALLERIVREARGAMYPAKDVSMSGESFRQFFPQWERFAQSIDPRCSSSFWRRVMGAKS